MNESHRHQPGATAPSAPSEDSRELGGWLFENLLGYRRDERRADSWWCDGARHHDCDIRPNHRPDELMEGDGMLLVLDAMRARGWDPYVACVDGTWWAGSNAIPPFRAHYHGDTAPRAVAEAARASEEASRGAE